MQFEENAYLCDVAPGRPMHNALKRYWIPAGLSSDLPEPDAPPVRITLLCQNYVMFRDSEGKIGILNEHCAHRGASLALGRVEAGGIRCIYHGWQFNTEGDILAMPNVADTSLGPKFKQPAYPVREAGGMIWVYLGPAEHQPEFPHFPFFDVPESCRYIGAPLVNANFVQVLEGGIDSAHLGVLHSDVHSKNIVSATDNAPVTGQVKGLFVNAVAPRVEVADTSWGLRYAALRDVASEAGTPVTQARVTAFFFPFCSNVTDEGTILFAVPLTSEWTVHYHAFWKSGVDRPETRLDELITLLGWKDEALKKRESARLRMNVAGTVCRENNFMQNRDAMRRGETFSGIPNVVLEDIAVTETMGAISDRTIEHLVPTDAAVHRVRRALIRNARAVEKGEAAAGISLDEVPAGGQGFVTPERPWQSWFTETNRATAAE